MKSPFSNTDQFSELWCYGFGHAAWQAVLVVVIAISFVFFFRKMSAPIRYSLLVIALFKFLVPPFWSLPSGFFSQLPISVVASSDSSVSPEPGRYSGRTRNVSSETDRPETSIELPVVAKPRSSTSVSGAAGTAFLIPSLPTEMVEYNALTETSENRNVSSNSGFPSWFIVLFSIHLAGSAYFLFVWITRWISLQRLKGRCDSVVDPGVREEFFKLCKAMKVRRIPALLTSPAVNSDGNQSEGLSSPISFGCIRPTIVFPMVFSTRQADIRFALSHELAHLKRWDPWVNMLQNFVLILWWWNPASWVLNFWIRRIREDCCDDLAIETTGADEVTYSQSLINIAKLSQSSFTGNLGPAFSMVDHPLASRIKRIMDPNVYRVNRLSMASLLVLFLVGTCILPGLRAQTNPGIVSSTNPITEKIEGTDLLDNLRKEFEIQVFDTDGNAIKDANIMVSVWYDKPENVINRKKRRFDYSTNEQGEARVKFLAPCSRVRIWTAKKGFVTLFSSWEDRKIDDVPALYKVVLQPDQMIGGKVIDSAGNPVSGAKVEVQWLNGGRKVDQNSNSRLSGWLSLGDDSVKTDANGLWKVGGLPKAEEFDLQFRIIHTDFISDQRWKTMEHYETNAKDLLKNNARFVIRKGVPFTGTVVDPSGNGIEGALVVWGDDPYNEGGSQEVYTDKDGKFVTQALPLERKRLTVVAKGWMPVTKIVSEDDQSTPQKFQLNKGKKLHLKFVGSDGNPIKLGAVGINGWKDARSLYNFRHPNVKNSKVPYLINDDGEYLWRWAPEGKLNLVFECLEPKVRKNFSVSASDEMQTISIKNPVSFNGEVFNKETGERIRKYSITKMISFKTDKREKFFSLDFSREGFLDSKFSMPNIGFHETYKKMQFRFDSPGFESFTTDPYAEDQIPDFSKIEMKPATVREVAVIGTEGKLSQGANVWLVKSGDFLSFFQRYQTDKIGLEIHSKNKDGRYQFNEVSKPFAIVAISEDGFGQIYSNGTEKDLKLQIRKWAAVEGILLDDGKPVVEKEVYFHGLRPRTVDGPRIVDSLKTKTDFNGKFRFKRVPAFASTLTVNYDQPANGEVSTSTQLPIQLVPGQTKKVILGENGLTVKGKAIIVGESKSKATLSGFSSILVPVDGIRVNAPPKSNIFSGSSDLERIWNEKVFGGPNDSTVSLVHRVRVDKKGNFLAKGVKPGKYRLLLQAEEAGNSSGKKVGFGYLEFDTNDYKQVDRTIDLSKNGLIKVNLSGTKK